MSGPTLPVVILAGGLATRLGFLTRATPKCLVDVDGEPFVRHQLRQLQAQGIRKVVFCLGHLGGQVVDAVIDGSEFGLSVQYAFDGPKLLGTAGAIKRALLKLPQAFFVLYGDSYLECDYAAVESAYRALGKLSLMTVFSNQGRWDSSNVEYAGGRILDYNKVDRTERMRHIDYGLGIFDRRAFDAVPESTVHDLATVYRDMLARGELASFETTTRFYEVGTPEGLAETREHLAGLSQYSPR